MLATAGGAVPSGDSWRYEVKWDGVRAVVAIEDDGVHAWSRHGTVLTSAFPELAGLRDQLPAGTVLDGELIVCDGDGRPDFRRIRRRLALSHDSKVALATKSDPVTFVAFDLPRHGDLDLTSLSWRERRARLVDVLAEQGPGWMVNRVYGDGAALWEATRAQALEGVVAKRVDAGYQAGRRSDAWVKVKHLTRTALPVVDVRDDAVLVADAVSLRPIAWVDRLHPSVGRRSTRGLHRRGEGPIALCVVQHLASHSGGLREALVLALRPTSGVDAERRPV